jgi:predicted RecA/RadA family phage recombinase
VSQAEVKTVTDILPYVPAAAASAGDCVSIGSLFGIVATDLAASERGSVVVSGQISMPKVTGAISRGARVYWNPTGDPVGGTAGSGAITTSDSAGFLVGIAVEAALSGDAAVTVYVIPGSESGVQHTRQRFTIAQVNAGATVLAARAGIRYQMVDCALISIGGAAATATTVDILATQTTSVKLLAAAVAGLTQSTLLRAGATNATILADGVSFVANDVNTAITIGKTGSNVATATHIDVLLSYKMISA